MISDDFLAIAHEGFERLLIFDRPSYLETPDGDQNANKRLFLKIFHALMMLAVHADENV